MRVVQDPLIYVKGHLAPPQGEEQTDGAYDCTIALPREAAFRIVIEYTTCSALEEDLNSVYFILHEYKEKRAPCQNICVRFVNFHR